MWIWGLRVCSTRAGVGYEGWGSKEEGEEGGRAIVRDIERGSALLPPPLLLFFFFFDYAVGLTDLGASQCSDAFFFFFFFFFFQITYIDSVTLSNPGGPGKEKKGENA